jgi:hypothetical protein
LGGKSDARRYAPGPTPRVRPEEPASVEAGDHTLRRLLTDNAATAAVAGWARGRRS